MLSFTRSHCLVTAVAICALETSADRLLVGVSQVDITPPIGFRCGGGYREVISTDVHDPLFAKAIVLQQGEVGTAIVISDFLSVLPE